MQLILFVIWSLFRFCRCKCHFNNILHFKSHLHFRFNQLLIQTNRYRNPNFLHSPVLFFVFTDPYLLNIVRLPPNVCYLSNLVLFYCSFYPLIIIYFIFTIFSYSFILPHFFFADYYLLYFKTVQSPNQKINLLNGSMQLIIFILNRF